MWKAEEDFPRGGTHKKSAVGAVAKSPSRFEKQGKLAKDIVRTPKKRKLSVGDDDPEFKAKRHKGGKKIESVNVPLHNDLEADICVLGCVQEVQGYNVSVSLPGNVVAKLPITDISPAYTNLLLAVASGEDPESAVEIPSLESMIKPGMLLPVKIKDVQENDRNKKKMIQLSALPSNINSELPVKAMENGMLFYGTVASVEDHGYSIDLGVKNIQAFLKASDAEKFIQNLEEQKISVGQPLWCVVSVSDIERVRSGEQRVVTVKIDAESIKEASASPSSKIISLLPGMLATAVVTTVADTGLYVRIFSFSGTIHNSQLPKNSNMYKKGQEIPVRILYINPNSKDVQLSALPKLVNFNGKPLELFGDLCRGDIVDAVVVRTSKNKGVYFKLQGKVKAFAALSQLNDNSDIDNQDLTKFPVGLQCKSRVTAFNHMEGVALVTLKQSIISEKFLSVEDISVGDVVEVVVKEISSNGLLVKISKGIFSFISNVHLADVPLKHPEKKFEVGKKYKSRVLRQDLNKKRVYLTLKKSLVKTKRAIITDYSQLKSNMELEGYIMTIREKAVVVAFFNGVKGVVLPQDMGQANVSDPSILFYVGQVVRCRVVHFNAEKKKLKLSLNFGETVKEPKSEERFEDLVGKVVKAKIIRKDNNGFRVTLLPQKNAAHLPFFQLSDYHEVQELWRMALAPGDILPKVTVFAETQKNCLIVTMKESFIKSAEEGSFAKTFQDLKTGMLLPAVITTHQDYGIFLELVGGFRGLSPSKTLAYLQPSSLASLFAPGQSVTTRLTKIDSEKQRFLGSLRLDECYEGGIESSLAHLQSYLKSREEALSLVYAKHKELSVYADLSVGDIVEVKVTSVLKKGVLGDLPSGAHALATKHHFGGINPEEGKTYKAAVLFVDPLTPCVELTLEPKIIKAVCSRKENQMTKVKSGQLMKADVLLVKSDLMLMCLRAHGGGKLVYVPVKQHINDVDDNKPYKPGTFTKVVIKNESDGYQLAVLESQDPDILAKERTTNFKPKDVREHKYKPGAVVEATILAVHAKQINIQVGEAHGRVYITEIADSIPEGSKPLEEFKVGSVVKAKVIGLRDLKMRNYLPITNRKATKSLLECSLKASKLKCKKAEELLTSKINLKEGDKVPVFVLKVAKNKVWVQISLSQQGFVRFFHLSDNMNILNCMDKHIQPGQAYTGTVLTVENDDKTELSFTGSKMTVKEGEEVTAQISSLLPGVNLHVSLPDGTSGVVENKPTVLNYLNQFVRCKVVRVENSRAFLKLQDNCGVPMRTHRKRKTSLSETSENLEKKTKLEKRKEVIEKKKQEKKERKIEKERKLSAADDDGDSGVDEVKESSDSDGEKMTSGKGSSNLNRLSVEGFSWGGTLKLKDDVDVKDDDDDGDDDNTKQESSKGKKKRKRDEEKEIERFERSRADGDYDPDSTNDFDQLVLQSPNSSLVWLKYMAFHVELGEIEKARAVAEKALTTISFREEQEKKNVWLAYLNLEVTYGDTADVKRLLERAVSYNEPVDIYLKMCDIYVSNGKTEDAEQLFITISRKFKQDKSVWKAYGQYLFKSERVQAARNLLQRCIGVLDKKEHVEVITKFASLEFSNGDSERGRTMFENLIASYPGRTDIWSVYSDLVTKAGDIEGARQILERAVKQKYNAKKLSFLIQKFIKFEESHGTEDHIAKVKDMAFSVLES